jgi:DNA-binding PadR family transcriptional regulator
MRINTEKIQRFILKNYRHGEFYGYPLQKNLAEDGYEIYISRLYRILNDMNREGLLTSRWTKSKEGPRKKMYTLGEEGQSELNKILLDAIHTVHSFYGDYLLSLRNKVDVFDLIIGPINKKIISPKNIGFLFNSYTPLIGFFFRKIRETFYAHYYCLRPKGIENDEFPENVTVLNGDYHDIPLKGSHLDALILIDLPEKQVLEHSVKEWSRTLNERGVLSILTPSVLLRDELDPMTIGEYVEKTEHHIIEKGTVIDYEQLYDVLIKFFHDVEKNNIVHITTITGQKR